MPWMSWSPKGDRLAYFVRTEKERTLIVQNVLTRKIEERIADEVGGRAGVAELLARRPDGRVRGAARRHRRHLHGRSATPKRSPTSPTTTSPTTGRPTRPTASSSIYNARVSGNQKLFRLDLDTEEEDADHLRHAWTRRRRSSSTTTRSCSRRRPPIPTCRSIPRSRRTATSTTSGRST